MLASNANGPVSVQARITRSWASWWRSNENDGLTPIEKYSLPTPRTKPVISRPPVMQSIIACSSASVSGCSRRQNALPRMAILTSRVRRASADAITTGDGISP